VDLYRVRSQTLPVLDWGADDIRGYSRSCGYICGVCTNMNGDHDRPETITCASCCRPLDGEQKMSDDICPVTKKVNCECQIYNCCASKALPDYTSLNALKECPDQKEP
jgi:hypothetical protein